MKNKRNIIYWTAVIMITIVFTMIRLALCPDSSLGGYIIGVLDMCACNVVGAFVYDKEN